MEDSLTAPARMHLINLATGEDKEAMFNPEQIVEEVQVAYNRITVPGMSHQPLQYSHTANHGLPLDLYFEGFTLGARERLDDWRRFILSLCYAKGNAGSIGDGAPPRVIFLWPNVFEFTCVIMGARLTSTSFSVEDLRITRMMATITIEEIRDVRLTSEEVRRSGTRRSPSGSGSSGS